MNFKKLKERRKLAPVTEALVESAKKAADLSTLTQSHLMSNIEPSRSSLSPEETHIAEENQPLMEGLDDNIEEFVEQELNERRKLLPLLGLEDVSLEMDLVEIDVEEPYEELDTDEEL